MTLEFALESTQGRRPDNQDNIYQFESAFGSVFLLADGMGGHQGGGVASKLATSNFAKALEMLPELSTPDSALAMAIQEVNRIIYEQSQNGDASLRRMGSTIVALLVSQTPDGLFAIGAHVGDSRLYFGREDKMFRLTKDHTMVEQLRANSTLTEEEAKHHPQAGVLTRALGQKEAVEVDITSWMLLKPGDIFLLCSDGLSSYVGDNEIRQIILQRDSCNAIALNLLDMAAAAGSDDNVSALVVRTVPWFD